MCINLLLGASKYLTSEASTRSGFGSFGPSQQSSSKPGSTSTSNQRLSANRHDHLDSTIGEYILVIYPEG
jgi:hypothetical protein